MKRVTFYVLMLALVVTASLSARGTAEGAAATTANKLTLKGNVYFEDRILPLMKSGGKDYYLMVPRWTAFNVDIKEGEEITVEGYAVTGMPYWNLNAAITTIQVTKATIKGKDYDLSVYGWGYWGGYGPMMGGRGRGVRGYRW